MWAISNHSTYIFVVGSMSEIYIVMFNAKKINYQLVYKSNTCGNNSQLNALRTKDTSPHLFYFWSNE